MKIIQVTLLSVLACVTLVAHASASRCPKYLVKVVKGTAYDAHGLTPVVDKFRKILGGEDNGNDPPTGGEGQRSINWDADIVPFNMPFDFFNTKVPRGAIFTALNDKFAVSNPAHPPPYDDRFSSIIGKFLSQRFVRFSLKRLFTPVDDNEFFTTFEVPGARYKRALTRGFGAVFTDVVYPGPTKIAFYDEFDCAIAELLVPPREKGLSFVGIVVFDKHYRQLSAISSVGMVLGEVPISHVVKGRDLVVVDDLIYGEPVAKKKFKHYGGYGHDFHHGKDFHRGDHFDH